MHLADQHQELPSRPVARGGGSGQDRAGLLEALPWRCLLVVAIAFLLGSCLPFAPVRAYLDRFAWSGSADTYTPAVHAGILGRVRLAGAGCLVAALCGWRYRKALARLGRAAAGQARGELRSVWRWLWHTRHDAGPCAALLALTLLAAALRLAFLFQPMRYDEAFTYAAYASQPAHVVLSRYDYPNNHVFHSLCVHACCRLFGGEPWAIRLPAFLAGVLMVPACYAAGRALFDRTTALWSSSLVGGSSILVEFSTNARGYTLVALCTLLLLALGGLVLRRRTVLGWGLFTVLPALGFWTVPAMLFPYGTVMLWLGIAALTGRETAAAYDRSFPGVALLSGGLTVLLTALLYAPILLLAGPGALSGNRFVAPLDWARWHAALASLVPSVWAQWQRDVPAGLTVALGIGFAVAVCAPRRAARAVPLVGGGVVWCVAVMAIQRVVAPERVWLFALPLSLIVSSAGLVCLLEALPNPRWRRLAMTGGVAVLALLVGLPTLWSGSIEASPETGTLRDAAGVTRFLRGQLRPGDGVLSACPSDSPLLYYFRRSGLPAERLLTTNDLARWQGERLFVVVNKTHGQTLASLAERYRLEPDTLRSARLVQELESAAVFELPRSVPAE